jgi:acetolactate decarboxylase
MRLLFFVLLSSVLMIRSDPRMNPQSDDLYYASLNEAIHLGQYDGVITINELKTHGNFGLGSEEHLAGELVLLNGIAYSIPASGKARIMPKDSKLAFAAVKFFASDKKLFVKRSLTMAELESLLDSVITQNSFAAIRIRAHFASIEYRSFEEQTRPYKPIKDVKEIPFAGASVHGTLVGFFTPKAAEVLNSPVYHFHYIDNDKTTGGHLLDCKISQAEIDIDYTSEFTTKLANPSLLQHVDLNE